MVNQKLKRLVRSVNQATLEDLHSIGWIIRQIRKAGLKYLPTGAAEIYGSNNQHMNFHGAGFIQIPDQLAPAAAFMSTFEINSFLEIGTNNGWTAVFLAAYLRRFNPNLQSASVDIQDYFELEEYALRELGLRFHCEQTSDDFRGTSWDMVFIDGDHRIEWVERDWNNLANGARYVLLHDVNDSCRFHKENVGAVHFWRNLKKSSREWAYYEFFDAPGTANSMGIGIAVRKAVSDVQHGLNK